MHSTRKGVTERTEKVQARMLDKYLKTKHPQTVNIASFQAPSESTGILSSTSHTNLPDFRKRPYF